MTCSDTEEFVSALSDGQPIPHDCAEHIAQCANCQELLKDFSLMAGQLRSFASLARSEAVPQRAWAKPGGNVTEWWTKGWRMMRIPRVVVATLALIILGLGSKLALIQARAHSQGSVLALDVQLGDNEHPAPCVLSVVDAKRKTCGALTQVQGVSLAYDISFLRQEGERVLLGIRSEYPPNFEGLTPEDVKTMPETQKWFTPGDTLPLDIAGGTKVAVTGQWLDHMPAFLGPNDTVDPAAGELRIISPVILQNGKVAQDFKGMSAIASKPGLAIQLYWPGGGMFSFSPIALQGAVVAKVEMNRISFIEGGQSYQVVTALPVSRTSRIWVLHDASYSTGKPNTQIGTQPVSEMH